MESLATTHAVATRDSAPMLAAVGILAYAASMLTHEALGHGGLCVALGGHNTMLTTLGESCSIASLGIEAAGPGVQFTGGLLAWLALHLISPSAVRVRYLLWLYMAYCLLIASGYVAFSGITDFGDAAVLIAGREPHLLWRGALVLLGGAVYYAVMRAAAVELGRFAGPNSDGRRLARLVWVPYLAVGVFACCCGLLNRTMGHGIAIGLAAASSLGGGFGLTRLPDFLSGSAGTASSPTSYVRWNLAWGIAAGAVIGAFLVFIGPGLQ